jgi:SAM-dependent methyltransferase
MTGPTGRLGAPGGTDAPGDRGVPGGTGATAWSAGDVYGAALRTGRGPLFLLGADGRLLPLDVERWCAAPDTADRLVLAACAGPTLDIGCGPGRMVAALAAGGRSALGVDVSAEAVRRTTAAGGSALRRSVFDRLPGEGAWRTVLLLDGNVGIGGDPAALLARAHRLACPGGTLIAEAAPHGLPEDLDERAEVRFHDGSAAHGPPFPWARLGPAALARHAVAAGWAPEAGWSAAGRRFLVLRRVDPPGPATPGAGPRGGAAARGTAARRPVPPQRLTRR